MTDIQYYFLFGSHTKKIIAYLARGSRLTVANTLRYYINYTFACDQYSGHVHLTIMFPMAVNVILKIEHKTTIVKMTNLSEIKFTEHILR